mmetsp:Transcript_67305/g.217291  ORF Transcript_67305/g.217291 Transcript_67305/m.217291 type:complete len:264 (+) Transcript_67305:727-1518(+)
MEAQAPDVPGGVFVGVDRLRPHEHLVAVVVPDDELEVQAALLQRRPQVVAHEVALLLGAVLAALPPHLAPGLVLHREAPQGQPGRFDLSGEAHVVARPRLPAVLPELAAVAHRAGLLHPGRRTPRAGDELQGLLRRVHRPADHRQDRPLVVLQGEAGELEVVRLVAAGPVAPGEVAGGRVQAAHGVAQPDAPVEVGVQHPQLRGLAQLRQQVGRGLREGAPEAQEYLVLDRRDQHRHGAAQVQVRGREQLERLQLSDAVAGVA